MDYVKDIDKLTGFSTTWKPCEHKGKLIIKGWWIFKKNYLKCDKCGVVISEKHVKMTEEILNRK